MNKKEWLDKLFYEVGKQQYNFDLCYMNLEGEEVKSTKWRNYLDAQSDGEFIEAANNRTILPNEIELDIEDPKKISRSFR